MADLLDTATAPPDLWSLLRQDPFAPNNPTAQSGQYPGVSNQDVYNAQRNSVGNVGALLLSAAQRQSPDQKARTIAEMGNAANIQPQLNAQQQILMRNQQMQLQQAALEKAKMDIAGQKRAEAYFSKPEVLDAFKSLPQTQQALAAGLLQAGHFDKAIAIIDSAEQQKTTRVGQRKYDVINPFTGQKGWVDPWVDQPPMPDARKAPDGNWYVPDPQRPGKFMMVK